MLITPWRYSNKNLFMPDTNYLKNHTDNDLNSSSEALSCGTTIIFKILRGSFCKKAKSCLSKEVKVYIFFKFVTEISTSVYVLCGCFKFVYFRLSEKKADHVGSGGACHHGIWLYRQKYTQNHALQIISFRYIWLLETPHTTAK